MDKLIRKINNEFPFKDYMVQKNIVRPKYFFVMTHLMTVMMIGIIMRIKKNLKIILKKKILISMINMKI